MKTQKYKSDFDKLRKLTEQMSPEKGDKRYWKLGRDKSGNGMAVIRFLPEISSDKTPYVTFWEHYYKGENNKWLVEKCIKSIGHDCPICEANQPNWALEDKTVARTRKAKHYFLANILVISDLINSENNGKVFIFKFGEKLFDKLKEKISPIMIAGVATEEALNPFSIEDGADFVLKGNTVTFNGNESFTYDNSSFKEASDLTKRYKKEELDLILEGMHDISAELKYKTPEELEALVNKVHGTKAKQTSQTKTAVANSIADHVSSDTKTSYDESYEEEYGEDNELESEEDFAALLQS